MADISSTATPRSVQPQVSQGLLLLPRPPGRRMNPPLPRTTWAGRTGRSSRYAGSSPAQHD